MQPLGSTDTAGVANNLAFLRASLSYGANDVFLTLRLTSSGFEAGDLTPNQKAGRPHARPRQRRSDGRFETLLNAIAGLAVQIALAFMNAFGQQATRGGQGAGHMAARCSA
ncbi:MAG TPA: hypothetical protein VGJ56_04525 [Reyranella sp.]